MLYFLFSMAFTSNNYASIACVSLLFYGFVTWKCLLDEFVKAEVYIVV